jgi:hypothetical protein
MELTFSKTIPGFVAWFTQEVSDFLATLYTAEMQECCDDFESFAVEFFMCMNIPDSLAPKEDRACQIERLE